jgi:hypothetical protein
MNFSSMGLIFHQWHHDAITPENNRFNKTNSPQPGNAIFQLFAQWQKPLALTKIICPKPS